MAVSEDHASCWVHKDLTVTTKQIQAPATVLGKYQRGCFFLSDMIVSSLQDFINHDSRACVKHGRPVHTSDLRGHVGGTSFMVTLQVADWPKSSDIAICIHNEFQGVCKLHNMCVHSRRTLPTAFCLVVSLGPDFVPH